MVAYTGGVGGGLGGVGGGKGGGGGGVRTSGREGAWMRGLGDGWIDGLTFGCRSVWEIVFAWRRKGGGLGSGG